MNRIVLLFLFLLAGPVGAQTVSVRSGEHGDFTRLVVTFPQPSGWTIGRIDNGYGLQARTTAPYDLTSVYRLITRDRLRSIWVEPASGVLQLGLGCDCHVIPFELNERTLVIDIRDGAPPASSSFELRLADGTLAPPVTARPPDRPVPRPVQSAEMPRPVPAGPTYDWLAGTTVPSRPVSEPSGLETGLELDQFRQRLIEELGRGATTGVVDMEDGTALRSAGPESENSNSAPEQARVALETLPNLSVSAAGGPEPSLTVKGETCPDPALLDPGQWSDGSDAATQLAQARASILTEFDVTDPLQAKKAVQTFLHYGFGAEARGMIDDFLEPAPDNALLVGMSYLVDGEPPPANPFESLQNCDSAAALWALLAAPDTDLPDFVNGAAASRSFLGLPLHMRALLGPELSNRLLDIGDTANAEVVRQSFTRSVDADSLRVPLLDAEQALRRGEPEEAEAMLPEGTSGDAELDRLLTLTEARFRQRIPLDGKDLLALEAFGFEQDSGPHSAALDRALAHAQALGGAFEPAFARAGDNAALTRDVWTLLAEVGADSALLHHATTLDEEGRAALPVAIRSQIADRLLEAGLPNAAALWASEPDVQSDIMARIALANKDARSAMRLLSANLPSAEDTLLAQTYADLGDFRQAADIYRRSGDTAAADRVLRWAGLWDQQSETVSPWTDLAALAGPSPDDAALPPLRSGAAQLEASAETRNAITALLDEVQKVEAP